MANSKKKQEEEHLKVLREIVALPHNKQCLDCNQRGPTYVNMTIGSFICTSCSGLLRGLNPPHRVKSISMASFTAEEIDFIKSRGNDLCRKVWLGIHDGRVLNDVGSKDENKTKDLMGQRYEKKRWYTAPTDEMYEQAKQQNTSAAKQTVKPISHLVNNNLPKLSVHSSETSKTTVNANPPLQSVQRPLAANIPPSISASPGSQQQSTPFFPAFSQQSQTTGSVDLLADLSGDAFQGSAKPVQAQGFFSATNSMNQPLSASAMKPVATQNAPSQFAFPTVTSTADKYSALAELEGVFNSGSSVSWNSSSSATGISWNNSSSIPANTIPNYNSQPQYSQPQYSGFTSTPAANPFASGGYSVQSSGIANPFTMSGNVMPSEFQARQPMSSGYPQFSQPTVGYGQFSASMPPSSSFMGVSTASSGFQQPSQTGWMTQPQPPQQYAGWPQQNANPFASGASASKTNTKNPFL